MLDRAVAAVLDVEPAWYAEVDTAASTVYAAHHPGVPNVGDITTADWAAMDLVDVLCAGFPCQPFSMSGKRRGSGDERDLWPVRKTDVHGRRRRGVVDAIAALRPDMVLLENVPGLLTMESGTAFATIVADLDALGYTVRWAVVGACLLGFCHHRHRLFIAATRGVDPTPGGEPFAWRDGGTGPWQSTQDTLFGGPQLTGWPPAGVAAGGSAWSMPTVVCGDNGILLPTPTARIGDGRGWPSAETAAQRMADGRRNLEDAVALLPTPTARDASRGAGWGDQTGRPLSEVIAELASPRPTPGALGATPRASDAAKGGPNQRGSAGDLMLPAAVQPGRWGQYASAVARQERLYGVSAPEPTEPGRLGKPRLAAALPEWMMGLPPGWITDHVTRNDAIRIAGNGVVWPVAAHAYRQMLGLTSVAEVAA